MSFQRIGRGLLSAMCLLAFGAGPALAQPLTTAFTYQGDLRNGGTPATGLHDLQFRLYDAAAGPAQVGATVCADNVSVADGRFTVLLDFGAQFAGQQRFLEIDVRADTGLGCADATGFVTLSPRQALTAVPYALYSLTAASATSATTAASATNAAQLNGQAAAFYLNASNLNAGTLPPGLLSGTYSGALTFSNAANSFSGGGAGLTGLVAANIASGTLADARLSANVPLLGATQTFAGVNTFSNASNAFTGSGAGLTGLNAGNISSGTLANARTTGTATNTPNTLVLRDAAGSFAAASITGNGAGLTNLNASNLTNGTVPDARLLGTYSNAVTFSNSLNSFNGSGTGLAGLDAGGISSGTLANARTTGTASNTANTLVLRDASGNFSAGTITGNGSGLTNLNASNISSGTLGNVLGGNYTNILTFSNAGNSFVGIHSGTGFGLTSLNASNITLGTLTNARTTGTSSNTADTLVLRDGSGNFSAGTITGNGSGLTSLNATNISSGTLANARLPVPLTLNGTNATHIIRGENASTTAGAAGVYGLSSAASGNTWGVYGTSASPDAKAVVGLATNTSGIGLAFGVYGQAYTGYGIYGLANSPSGIQYGVYGTSPSPDGNGVFGKATAASGINFGVGGESSSTSGRGIFGDALAASGTTYGVYGAANGINATGWAVYAVGDMGASGTKPFRIDHPDDPANKYLLHYAAESPEVINFYSGKVTLDDRGEAVVELPHYFARINKDPRYTLTAVGSPMPMLHVAEEIDEAALSAGARAGPGEAAPVCSFRIAGGAPGAKVSWRVEALRNDRWVQKRGAPVEVEKQDLEKGTYQHPELYGQPPEKGMHRHAPERPAAGEVETMTAPAAR